MERSQTRSESRLEKRGVCNAFKAIAQGFSTDRVIADPALNQLFLAECRERDLTGPDEDLNRCLLNARKANHLSACDAKHGFCFGLIFPGRAAAALHLY